VSTLWTPSGEHRVPRPGEQPAPEGPTPPAGQSPPPPDGEPVDFTDPQLAEQLTKLQEELLTAPAATIVANHAYHLFELARLHLSQPSPKLDQAKVAIDAFGALVDGMAGRLGEDEPHLRDALSAIRLLFVQVSGE
jgi:hypothetical protein